MPAEKNLGVVLLAHGSYDPEAAAEAGELCRLLAASQSDMIFAAAYLNREPALAQAIGDLCDLGCTRIEVFPLLVFQGKHAREDIPILIEAERRRHPQLRLGLQPHLTRLPGFISILQRAVLELESP